MHRKKFLSILLQVDSIGQFACINSCVRGYSTVPEVSKEHKTSKMLAWQIHCYGGLEELQLSKTARIPQIKGPNDILIQVCASSINPIDLAMMGKRQICLWGFVFYLWFICRVVVKCLAFAWTNCHHEDGASVFLRNVGTFNHCPVQKPERKLSFDQQPLWTSENLYLK